MQEKLTPKTANTFDRVCELPQDNISTRKSWMTISEEDVYICNQKNGEVATGSVRLTKKEFERFIKFYETGT